MCIAILGSNMQRSRCVLFFKLNCQLAEEVVGLLAAEPCRCRVLTGIQKAHRATPEQDLAVKMQIASLMARILIAFDADLRLTTS